MVQDLQFLGILLRLDLGEASLPEPKAWEIVACAHCLSSLRGYHLVSQLMGSLSWASGLIPLGHLYLRPLQRHSLGLTDRFTPPHRVDQIHWSLPAFYGTGKTYIFLPQESLSALFRRISQFLRTLPLRGGALTWGIPRFRVPGPVQTASSISIVWSSRL